MESSGSKLSRLRKDPAWKYGNETPTPAGDGVKRSYVYIDCNFCHQVIKGGVMRLKEHLACTSRNVRPCPQVPDEVKQEISDYMQKKETKKQKRQDEFDHSVDSGSYFDISSGSSRNIRGPMDRFMARGADESNEEASKSTPPANPKEARRLVCLDIGRFFFENGIAFNCIESPSFVSMCRSIANFGRGLKTPSRHELSTWILKEEVKTTDTHVDEIKKTWIQTGVSILSDGWKDMRGRSLINFLVNNPYGTVFLKSIDASDAIKDANMLFELLDGIVDEVGENLVVQVVTDNASNYKAAGKLLMAKRKRLYWTPCAAHCLDLMLEKIGELPQHKNALLKGRKVSNFIYNHGWVLSMMRRFTNRELIRPAVTRFATAFLTLESMLQSKQPLEAMFSSAEWANSTWAKKSEGKAVKKIILHDSTFWPSVLYALSSTRPLVKVLRMVDGEQMPAMGFIYGAIDEAKEEIARSFGNELGKYKEIWEIIDAKWEHQLHREIHAAAHFLNPRQQYSPNFSNHREIKKGLMSCMEKLIPNDDLTAADLQLDMFRTKQGFFGRRQALDTYKSRTPANWWTHFGDETPELQSFAVKVLSLTCSASACERNWSMFNQVHTKKRNRLTTLKLNKLVYVMYNKRLKDRHMQKRCRVESVDPLEVEYLSSDDEWFVDDEETVGGTEDRGNNGPMDDEEFEALLNNVPPRSDGTSSGRGRGRGSGPRGRGSGPRGRGRGSEGGSNKRKRSANEKGKDKEVANLIDEESEWEDEAEDEEDEEEDDLD